MATPHAYDSEILGYYSQTADAYLSSRPEVVSRHLASFLALLKPASSILELSCGAGRDAQAMIKAGFAVDPTDGIAEIAASASQLLGQIVRVMRFDELIAIDTYNAVWANASLLHVPRDQLVDILRLIFTALKLGGYHFANFKAGSVEGRDERARYYNYLSHEQMIMAYAQSGDWEIVPALDYLGGARFETQQIPWVSMTVRKKS